MTLMVHLAYFPLIKGTPFLLKELCYLLRFWWSCQIQCLLPPESEGRLWNLVLGFSHSNCYFGLYWPLGREETLFLYTDNARLGDCGSGNLYLFYPGIAEIQGENQANIQKKVWERERQRKAGVDPALSEVSSRWAGYPGRPVSRFPSLSWADFSCLFLSIQIFIQMI